MNACALVSLYIVVNIMLAVISDLTLWRFDIMASYYISKPIKNLRSKTLIYPISCYRLLVFTSSNPGIFSKTPGFEAIRKREITVIMHGYMPAQTTTCTAVYQLSGWIKVWFIHLLSSLPLEPIKVSEY